MRRLWWGLVAVVVLPGCSPQKGGDDAGKAEEAPARPAPAPRTGLDQLTGEWKRNGIWDNVRLVIADGGKGEVRAGEYVTNWFRQEWKGPLRKAFGAKADEDEFEDRFEALEVTVQVTIPFELSQPAPDELDFRMGPHRSEYAIPEDFLAYVARSLGEPGQKEVAAMREKLGAKAKEVGDRVAKAEADRLRHVKYEVDFLLLKLRDPNAKPGKGKEGRAKEPRATIYHKQGE